MKHIEDKKVKDLMTYGIISMPDHAKAMDAIKILLGRRVHGVVVVGKKGRAVGVVSELDISKAVERNLEEVTVAEIMSTPVRDIGADATIREAVAIMREKGLGRLYVLDENGFPEGALSITNITHEIASSYFK